MPRFYHYTSRRGLNGILSTKCIMKGHTKHPVGWIHGIRLQGNVFLTKKDPSTYSKKQIAMNNYRNGWEHRMDCVECFIVVDIPTTNQRGQPQFVKEGEHNNVVAYLPATAVCQCQFQCQCTDLQLEHFRWEWGYTDMSFTVRTYNVHYYKTKVDQVAEFLNQNPADIVCLQECSPTALERLKRQLTQPMKFFLKGNNCAIVSTTDLQPVASASGAWGPYRGYLTAWLPALGFHVTCLHLESREERQRLKELAELQGRLAGLRGPMVWAGDLNSLTRKDYSTEEWREIARVRKNQWEEPRTDVTDRLRESGLVDCWTEVGEQGQLGPLATRTG
jgi:hypothetical protein